MKINSLYKHAPVLLVLLTLWPTAFAAPSANPASTNIAKPAQPAVNLPANPQLPSLFLIGDSTVRNGHGRGDGGQWGWGDFLAPFFDTNRINVVNRALGGTSSRTFYRDQWPRVAAMLKPGDFVIMQFGHNDSSALNDTNRARGTIKGVGDETRTMTNLLTQQVETVHSFGWYERTLIAEARAKGATPMVCSLIPRNNWNGGRAARNRNDYAGWAAGGRRRKRAVPRHQRNHRPAIRRVGAGSGETLVHRRCRTAHQHGRRPDQCPVRRGRAQGSAKRPAGAVLFRPGRSGAPGGSEPACTRASGARTR